MSSPDDISWIVYARKDDVDTSDALYSLAVLLLEHGEVPLLVSWLLEDLVRVRR